MKRKVLRFVLYSLGTLGLGILLSEVVASQSLRIALEHPGYTTSLLSFSLPAFPTAVVISIGWAVLVGRKSPRRAKALWGLAPLVLCPLLSAGGIEWLSVFVLIFSVSFFLGVLVGSPWRGSKLSLVSVVLLYFAVFTTLSFLQYSAMNITYTDTANFEELLWRTLRGEFMRSSGFEHIFLAEHIEFSQFYFLPVYIFLPDLRTLMLLETGALSSGAIALYLLGKRVRSPRIGLSVAVVYLLYPALQYLDLEAGGAFNTFRPENLAIPLLLWMLYFFEGGEVLTSYLFAGLALLCKEEYGVVLFAYGIYAFLRRKVSSGLIVSGVGIAWFVLSVTLVIPYFRGGLSHTLTYYSHLAENPENPTAFSIVLGILKNPLRPLRLLVSSERIQFALQLLVPLGLLPILGWRVSLVALPSALVLMLSRREATFWPIFHYHAPLVPFLCAGVLYGLKKVEERRGGNVANFFCGFVVFCSLLSNVLLSKSPISLRFYDPDSGSHWSQLYKPTDHSRKLKSILRLIPRDAKVSASLFLATYFTHYGACWVFPGRVEEADFIAIDLTERWIDSQRDSIREICSDPRFRGVYSDGEYIVLKRR